MVHKNHTIPAEVHSAAQTAWSKWSEEIASIPPIVETPKSLNGEAHHANPEANQTPAEKMIAKIKRRMTEYPEWYETDPDKVAASVTEELERIGSILSRKLPGSEDPIDVWNIPLSVFNWLIESDVGEHFHHGALSAWSSAENFNAANAVKLDSSQRTKLRQRFLDDSPVLLRAVLQELLKTDLWISFAEKFEGPELKYLVMRVQRPVVVKDS
jgi:hypothetical protein